MFLSSTLELLLPRNCCTCSTKLLPFEKQLCTTCLADMPKTYYWNDSNNPMALMINDRILKSCGDPLPPFVSALALYFYEGNYKKISRALKYQGLRGAAVLCGGMLGHILMQNPEYQDVDYIVPVPLHFLRRLSRGYNQAQVIARAIASEMPGVRLSPLLKRSRYTRSQARLNSGEKSRNVEGAFSVACPDSVPRHILVVDDVCTTGSTLCECHKALWLALVERFGSECARKVKISLACLAFAGK